MAKAKIICGVEIESEYSTEKVGYLDKRSYHSSSCSKFGENFYMESDSSIRTCLFNDTVEFISIPFNIKNHRSVLNSFRREFIKRSGENELKKVINFPNSTGCHIHISVLREKKDETFEYGYKDKTYSIEAKPIKFKQVVNFKTLKTIKETIAKRVKKELPSVYKGGWFKAYDDRNYAKKTEKLDRYSRHVDWNMTSRNSNEIEFRAFNLNGVETWEQFNKIFSIAFQVIWKVISSELGKKYCFEDEIKQVLEIKKPNKKLTKRVAREKLEFEEVVERIINCEAII